MRIVPVVVLDIDECSTSANTCRHACKNLIGSFVCTCPTGYRQIPGSDECRGKGLFVTTGLITSCCGDNVKRRTHIDKKNPVQIRKFTISVKLVTFILGNIAYAFIYGIETFMLPR